MRPEALVGLRQPDARSCGAAALVAARVLHDPARPQVPSSPDVWAVEVLAAHRALTGWPTPWPQALGTPPWALARALTRLTGVRHRTRLVRRRRIAAVRVAGAVYVGSRWLPRHVVLGLGDGRCYEPASGRLLPLDGRPLAGWSHRWFEVVPVPRATRT